MYNDKKILAIIPARSGSKRLPNKNILTLIDKPLIAWTILEAKKSKYIDEVIVSTDNSDIADISKKYNANVPFIRPVQLSSDTTSSFGVVEQAINYLKNDNNKIYDYALLLQPTSPLRNFFDINSAIELLFKKNADSVISVCKLEHPLEWSCDLPEDLSMNEFVDRIKQNRSQDLKTFYRLNGAIYISNIKRLIEEKTFFLKNNIFAYIMPNERSIDIDTLFDFDLVKFILSKNNS